MTLFSSLGARRFALLAVMFVIAVACAKVDRGYYDEGSSAGGGNSSGGSSSGAGGNKGKAGAGAAGKPSGGASSDAGSAGEADSAGSAGENSAGAAGAPSGTLKVVLAGDGAGVVSSDLPGIDCGATCSAVFDQGTEVVLTAKPDTKSTFTGWSGGGCSGTGPCTTIISDVTAINATFTALEAKLTVALAGNGSGVVRSVPTGIDCGSTCSASVLKGTSVQLTAGPAVGSVFTGWSGGGCTGVGTCTTTVTAATAVTATFALTQQTLTVVKVGTGTGTVTSAPAGINCGTDCSEVVNYGSVLTLSAAVLGTGSVFSGWSGGGCSGTATCVVTVTAATQVTANFSCSSGSTIFNYTGMIEPYTPPSCVTSLTIDAYGAQGGANGIYAGGAGARIKGTFAVMGGATFRVLVGGKGADAIDTAQQAGGSGGGGTFVTSSANAPFVVAGGGGGAISSAAGGWSSAGIGGVIGTAGTADNSGTNAGGVNGMGGKTDGNTAYHSGTGGGGLIGNGVGNSTGSVSIFGSAYSPGFAFANGGAGGVPGSCAGATSCIMGRNGGFGGGGAAGFTGGGGGGYSGGGAGHTVQGNLTFGAGGGGGSYNAGTLQTNTAATRIGNGMVIFSY